MELSGASVANAAAKIANTLVNEFDLEPGDRVGVHLPWHWQRVTWLVGIWSAGCEALPGGGAACALVVAGPREAAELAGEVQVVSTHPFGMPLSSEQQAQLPDGAQDVTLLVRAQPDQQLLVGDHSDRVALDGMTQQQLLNLGHTFAAEYPTATRLGITPGERQWWLPAIWPLVTSGSSVMGGPSEQGDMQAEHIDALVS
jgi:uncharacterized protein (TIGR03089 family)